MNENNIPQYYEGPSSSKLPIIIVVGIGILVALVVGAGIGAFSMQSIIKKKMQQSMAGRAMETYVTIQTPKSENVTLNKKYIAKVEAINAVDIKPQVSGYIEEIV